MIAGVHVAVEFHRHVRAALGRVHAYRGRAKHGRQGRIHVLDEDLADVGGQPLVEHLAQETPVGSGGCGTAGDAVPVLAVQERRGPGAPAALGLGQVGCAHALDDGDELQVASPQVVAEVAVHPLPVLLVRGVDRAQNVRLHARAGEGLPAAHNHRVCAPPATVEPVGVVQGSGPVDGHAHEEVVVREKARPLVGHQRAVSLQGVTHALGGATVALAQLNEALKKRQATQGRLPALPQHRDLAIGARLQERLDVTFQGLLGHGLRGGVVEQFLGQEKAILAIQVARCPRRFRDDGEGN